MKIVNTGIPMIWIGYKSSMSRTPTIYAHGYYAAAYADIYGTNDKPMAIELDGHFSG